jgi:hypothetical protein
MRRILLMTLVTLFAPAVASADVVLDGLLDQIPATEARMQRLALAKGAQPAKGDVVLEGLLKQIPATEARIKRLKLRGTGRAGGGGARAR